METSADGDERCLVGASADLTRSGQSGGARGQDAMEPREPGELPEPEGYALREVPAAVPLGARLDLVRRQDRVGQRTAVLVDTPARFAAFLAGLAAVQPRTLGLDTEAANVAEDLYRESPSLLQLALRRPEGTVRVGVIDLLALGDVRALQPHLARAPTVVFAHNWAYDERMLLRLGLRPRCVYDTCRAGKLLFEGAGRLADLSQRLLAAPMDKDLQSSDWGRRPLSREQIAYAARDAADTLAIGEMVRPLLPDIPAPRPALPPAARAAYRALGEWRSATAARGRRFPEDVLPQRTLRQIALQRPDTPQELGGLPGIGPTRLRRYGTDILATLAAVELASLIAGTPWTRLRVGAAVLHGEELCVRLVAEVAASNEPAEQGERQGEQGEPAVQRGRWGQHGEPAVQSERQEEWGEALPDAARQALDRAVPWRLVRPALAGMRLRCAISPQAQGGAIDRDGAAGAAVLPLFPTPSA